MTIYTASVTLHVLAAIIGFGTVFAMPVLRRHLAGSTAPAVELALAQRVLTPAMTVSLITGLYQTLTGPYGFQHAWITGSLAILLTLFAIAGAGITRDARRAVTLTQRNDADDADALEAALFRLTIWWSVAGLLVIAAVFLMVVKPT